MEVARSERSSLLIDKVEKFFNEVSKYVGVLAAAIVIIMVGQVFLDVGLRAILNKPLPATLEIVSYWWMVALSFLGLAYAKTKNEHISVTLISEALPPRMRVYGQILIETITAVCLLLLAYYSWGAAVNAFEVSESAAGIFPVPVWPARFFVPIGAGLYLLVTLVSLARSLSMAAAGKQERNSVRREAQND